MLIFLVGRQKWEQKKKMAERMGQTLRQKLKFIYKTDSSKRGLILSHFKISTLDMRGVAGWLRRHSSRSSGSNLLLSAVQLLAVH